MIQSLGEGKMLGFQGNETKEFTMDRVENIGNEARKVNKGSSRESCRLSSQSL